MEIWHAILLGLVQGATEFLPVSSSGHLFLTEYFLGLKPDLHFVIAVHAATLLAVVIVYWREIWQMLQGLVKWPLKHNDQKAEGLLALKLIVATLGTVVVALLIEPYLESVINLELVVGTLVVTGLLIIGAEYFRNPQARNFTWTLALVLGVVQGLAVLPGISRSGLTIAFLIWWGIGRQDSAKISFLLSIPTILGALVFSLHDQKSAGSLSLDTAQIIGCVVAFVVALLVIYWMKRLVEKHWIWFAPYCLILAGLLGIYTWLYA